mmetsp:Transcript_4206/g.9086  ORF Transcript_4206/g.9086 Transcript_4206/m.9086 type:complete len:400 (-) Transcript_4206:408-1607(-)
MFLDGRNATKTNRTVRSHSYLQLLVDIVLVLLVAVVSPFPISPSHSFLSRKHKHNHNHNHEHRSSSFRPSPQPPSDSHGRCRCRCRCFGLSNDREKDGGNKFSVITKENEKLYAELHDQITSIAKELWEGEEIPGLLLSPPQDEEQAAVASSSSLSLSSLWMEGEASLPEGLELSFSERGNYFRKKALEGCPRAQHSYGLLLWSGFASLQEGIEKNPRESAKFHAAAACQHHLDALAVFGGCLRTGTGIIGGKKQNQTKKKRSSSSSSSTTSNHVALGLKLIDFCSSVAGNPSGANKKAALLESNGNDSEAVKLYEECLDSGRSNALLLFNLGWSYYQGQGVDQKDSSRGIALWKEAAKLAPDEGSEEAAWNLYQEYVREDPNEAQAWLDLAGELGFYE